MYLPKLLEDRVDGKQTRRVFRIQFIIVGLFLMSVHCFAQDDLYNDDLMALVRPINISYLKEKGYREVEISHYKIQNNDTVFAGVKKVYVLKNDSILCENKTSDRSAENKPASFYKEDKFGYLYPVSISDGKEFQSKYVIDQNGLPMVRKSIYGKQYFFYDNSGQIIKSASDTFYIATNSPCNQSQFIYNDHRLVKKINTMYDAGSAVPISSDTLSFHYNSTSILTGYSPSVFSTLSSRGEVRIFYENNGKTIDLIRTGRSELVRYKFD